MPGKTFTQEDYIAQRKKRRADAESRAADTLKDHKYTALVDKQDVQVWRCAKPGSSCYAFDITLTRFGIAVVGDIDSLVFRVGLGYGLEFLAGDDIDYYIHSKLEERFKDRQLDESDFRAQIISSVCEMLIQDASDDDEYDALPEWVREESARGPDGSRWDELIERIKQKEGEAEAGLEWFDIWRHLVHAGSISDLAEANAFRGDHYEELNLGDDWWDRDISHPSQSLMDRLHMVRHAAKQILALKAKEAAA